MKSALEDVRVIEYGEFICAPYCGKLLADLGADVIKIEKPREGDIARKRGPFLGDIPGLERSGLFLYLNTNKLSITLDPQKATGREIFRKLIKEADVLIEDTKPGSLGSLELDYKHLESINQALVMVSITPFGQTGPYKKYKGSDLIAWHMGGPGYMTPRYAEAAEQEPLGTLHLASFFTGICAATAIMAALKAQRSLGCGQQIDISQWETVITSAAESGPYWPYEHRSVSRFSRASAVPAHIMKCKDGWVMNHASENHHWKKFVEMMGSPKWADEELFKDRFSRGEHWESLKPLIEEWTMKYSKEELFEMAKVKGIPFGPVQSIADVLECRQFKERGFFVGIEHPVTRALSYPGAPFQFSRTPWAVHTPAPVLGQHNQEIYCDQLGYSKEDLVKLYEAEII